MFVKQFGNSKYIILSGIFLPVLQKRGYIFISLNPKK